jgi:hypothetical protein
MTRWHLCQLTLNLCNRLKPNCLMKCPIRNALCPSALICVLHMSSTLSWSTFFWQYHSKQFTWSVVRLIAGCSFFCNYFGLYCRGDPIEEIYKTVLSNLTEHFEFIHLILQIPFGFCLSSEEAIDVMERTAILFAESFLMLCNTCLETSPKGFPRLSTLNSIVDTSISLRRHLSDFLTTVVTGSSARTLSH